VTGDNAGPLITVPELADLLDLADPAADRAADRTADPAADRAAVGRVAPARLTLLDVRWRLGGPPGRELFAAAHIPGAVFVDLDRDLAAAPGKGGRHPLPATADFETAMRLAGVRNDLPVVVYDDADSTAAARAWWLLRYFGHAAVRVLNGGFRAWAAAGHPTVSTMPASPSTTNPGTTNPGTTNPGTANLSTASPTNANPSVAGDFTARPGRLPLLEADEAAAVARTGLLLDARAGERYRGEAEPVDPVAGHIPGAVSAPTAENVNPDGTFRPPADLASRFAALGALPAQPLPAQPPAAQPPAAQPPAAQPPAAQPPAAQPPGHPALAVYCGSGVTAAHEILALTLAGIPDAALYAGSWSAWITDPSRPTATGPAPGQPPQNRPRTARTDLGPFSAQNLSFLSRYFTIPKGGKWP
jgi:thiosulfate/3-mercaptopyruvate sulfurtransferase